MNTEQIRTLKINLAHLARYYQRELSDIVLQMYADDLKDLEFNSVMGALSTYRLDQKNLTMPIPAKIRAIVERDIDPHDVAVLTAAKVVQAVTKFGYSNSEEALEFIGADGQAAVRAFGGWAFVCENLGSNIDITAFQAQVREIIKSGVKVSRMGIEPISITNQRREEIEFHKKKEEQVMRILEVAKPAAFEINVPSADERKKMIEDLLNAHRTKTLCEAEKKEA